MKLFGDQKTHTLSHVSSSAALSHSKAFQFMSSTEKDISFKYGQDSNLKHIYINSMLM